ncbi:uncharacterized protein O3Q21_008530 isoform 1-T3 [Podargus strigoides]
MISQLDPLLPLGKAGHCQLLQPQLQRAGGHLPRRAGAAVQLGQLLRGGGLCLHQLQPRVRVWPLHLVLHRASWEGMSPEPGGLQPQHPDLQLDQVHLRQRQEVHRRRLRDLALSLGGRGRLQPRSATGATQEEGRTEGERSVLPGERSEQRHERELRSAGTAFTKRRALPPSAAAPGSSLASTPRASSRVLGGHVT